MGTKISRLLEIATSKNDDFCEIYDAVKDKNAWDKIKLDSSEKDKIQKAVKLIDDQTYELMVPPLKNLKDEFSLRFKVYHGNQRGCNFGEAWSELSVKVSPTKNIKSYAWFQIYYEWVSKEGPWGLGMAITISELYGLKALSPERIDLERSLQKVIGKDWATTEEMSSYWNRIPISKEDYREEISEGGWVRFKQPLELKAGGEISQIHERILDVGQRSFAQKIPELKKFWRDKLRGI